VQGVSPVPNLCNVNVGQLITEEPVCVCGGGGVQLLPCKAGPPESPTITRVALVGQLKRRRLHKTVSTLCCGGPPLGWLDVGIFM
jgi:hypothetical protein